MAQINFSEGSGSNISSGDGRYEIKIGGRLHLDYVRHNYDSRMGVRAIIGSEVRRGRNEMDGVFKKN